MGKHRTGGGNNGANGAKSPSTMCARVDHALCRWTEFDQRLFSTTPFRRPERAEPEGRGESDGTWRQRPATRAGPASFNWPANCYALKPEGTRRRQPNTGGRDGPTARYPIGPTSQRESFMR